MARKPKQQRSKSTVDAIVRAGFLCVAENGPAGTTTRRIADKAGVSIGSLYEYFENKEQVFEAMNTHFLTEVTEIIRDLTPRLTSLDVDKAIRTLLYEFSEFLSKDGELYLNVLRHAPNDDLSQRIQPLESALQNLVMQYMMRNPEGARIQNIPATSYFFIHGGIFTLVSFLSDPNPPISFDELVDGIASVMTHHFEVEVNKT